MHRRRIFTQHHHHQHPPFLPWFDDRACTTSLQWSPTHGVMHSVAAEVEVPIEESDRLSATSWYELLTVTLASLAAIHKGRRGSSRFMFTALDADTSD